MNVCTLKFNPLIFIEIPILGYLIFTAYIYHYSKTHMFTLVLIIFQLFIYILFPGDNSRKLIYHNFNSDVMCCQFSLVGVSQIVHLVYGLIITFKDFGIYTENKQRELVYSVENKVFLVYCFSGLIYYLWVTFVVNVAFMSEECLMINDIHIIISCDPKCYSCHCHNFPKYPNCKYINLLNKISPKDKKCLICFEPIENENIDNVKKCLQCHYLVCEKCSPNINKCPNCRFNYGEIIV